MARGGCTTDAAGLAPLDRLPACAHDMVLARYTALNEPPATLPLLPVAATATRTTRQRRAQRRGPSVAPGAPVVDDDDVADSWEDL